MLENCLQEWNELEEEFVQLQACLSSGGFGLRSTTLQCTILDCSFLGAMVFYFWI